LFFLNSHSWIFFLSRRLFFIKKNLVWHVMIYIFLEFFWLAMRPRLVLAKPKWPVPWEQVWQKGQILADMILYQTSWTDSCVLRLHVPLSYILLEKALKTPINPTSPRGLTGKLNIHVTFCLVDMYPLWHIIWIKILCPSIFHVFFI
jgi:hypothetical protein